MTDDQRAQLNRFLAERVMGWVEGELNGNQVYRSYEGCEMFVNAWNPCELLRYCEPLLDKVEQDGWNWELGCSSPYPDEYSYFCCIHNGKHDGTGTWQRGNSRTEALALAIAKAYGYSNEKK